MPLSFYRFISFGKGLGDGITGSRYMHISAVAKTTVEEAPYCLSNEFICAEIGRFLRLPIPPSAIIQVKDEDRSLWFASLDYNLNELSLPPVDPSECFELLPDLSTGLLLFDILIANSDRHAKNLSLDTTGTTPRLAVFDHSHALFGAFPDQGAMHLQEMTGRLAITGRGPTFGNRHCLLNCVTSDDHFDKWVKRIEAIPDFLIDDLCDEAVSLGVNRIESEEAKRFLRTRRDNLQEIIESHKEEFTGIAQWRMRL